MQLVGVRVGGEKQVPEVRVFMGVWLHVSLELLIYFWLKLGWRAGGEALKDILFSLNITCVIKFLSLSIKNPAS